MKTKLKTVLPVTIGVIGLGGGVLATACSPTPAGETPGIQKVKDYLDTHKCLITDPNYPDWTDQTAVKFWLMGKVKAQNVVNSYLWQLYKTVDKQNLKVENFAAESNDQGNEIKFSYELFKYDEKKKEWESAICDYIISVNSDFGISCVVQQGLEPPMTTGGALNSLIRIKDDTDVFAVRAQYTGIGYGATVYFWQEETKDWIDYLPTSWENNIPY